MQLLFPHINQCIYSGVSLFHELLFSKYKVHETPQMDRKTKQCGGYNSLNFHLSFSQSSGNVSSWAMASTINSILKKTANWIWKERRTFIITVIHSCFCCCYCFSFMDYNTAKTKFIYKHNFPIQKLLPLCLYWI